ncbi:sensor histidine kinase NtrY-like [Candidatus Paracaedibacter symbiosus]|uniref:sensor histidine kinase NtrY-like n=1 Tax=Candidatus Paracaedibacter symbiosus TaxID=244582 RepID=UPI00068E7C78|nr:PAS domain-containing sensor histidine kinase [Candidatus Paracaedibacter symbiosus]
MQLPYKSPFQQLTNKILALSQSDFLLRRLGLVLSIAAILSGFATYIVLTGSDPFADKSSRVLPLIYLDLTLMMLLAVVVAKRIIELWVARRRGSVGSRLHVQISALFAFVAITPSIFVTIFSALFFNVGLHAWFGQPVRSALSEARVVAEAYLNEHSKTISHDAQEIAAQLSPQIAALVYVPEILAEKLTKLTEQRGIDEAIIFDVNRQVVARAYFTFALEFEKVISNSFDRAQLGEIVVVSSEGGDRVRALMKLDDLTETYLYIGKFVDPAVLQHVAQTKGAIAEYNRLDAQRSGLQITFVLFFSMVALLLLLAAAWAGLTVANLFVRPIMRLITAAEEVSQGNLDVHVTAEGSMNNELGNLAEAFNKMTYQLANQRQDLIKANTQIDQRRQFMETILARISAGVMSIDKNFQIVLMNGRARELLDVKIDPKNRSLRQISPEFIQLLMENEIETDAPLLKQVTIVRGNMVSILQTGIVVDQSHKKQRGFIITFDDVTPLVSAQRKAAWSDVARKIAHEIKNPLTPIQLSAERLKRRYLKEITNDPATFQACTDTIIRQVSQIGKLVNEFSSFARMPDPEMKPENIIDLARQAIFLQRQAHPEIKFIFNVVDDSLIVDCDADQLGQVLTNVLQNAINAVSLDEIAGSNKPGQPIIQLSIEKSSSKCRVVIEDNGPGFPVQGRERLTEPYYTTHSKGTGLGLAIVAKIVEDHRGKLELTDSHLGGAKVVIEFLSPTKRADN